METPVPSLVLHTLLTQHSGLDSLQLSGETAPLLESLRSRRWMSFSSPSGLKGAAQVAVVGVTQ